MRWCEPQIVRERPDYSRYCSVALFDRRFDDFAIDHRLLHVYSSRNVGKEAPDDIVSNVVTRADTTTEAKGDVLKIVISEISSTGDRRTNQRIRLRSGAEVTFWVEGEWVLVDCRVVQHAPDVGNDHSTVRDDILSIRDVLASLVRDA